MKSRLEFPTKKEVRHAFDVIHSGVVLWMRETSHAENVSLTALARALRDSWLKSGKEFPGEKPFPHHPHEGQIFQEKLASLASVILYHLEPWPYEVVSNQRLFEVGNFEGRFERTLQLTIVKLEIAFAPR